MNSCFRTGDAQCSTTQSVRMLLKMRAKARYRANTCHPSNLEVTEGGSGSRPISATEKDRGEQRRTPKIANYKHPTVKCDSSVEVKCSDLFSCFRIQSRRCSML